MQDQEIRISVVIPLYNGSDHIQKCIEELDKQDCLFQFEVFIVDDASTDSSANIVEQQIKGLTHQEYFKLIRSPHNGRAGLARNIGMKASRGHYILFIDQDDYPDTRLLRVLWENSKDGTIDLVSCAVMDHNDRPFYRPELSAEKPLVEDVRKQLIHSYGYVFASLIRRNLLINNRIYFAEKVMFEDCLYNAGIISCVENIQTIKDVLYFRTNNQESQTGSFSSKKLNDRINAVLIYLTSYKKNDKMHVYIKEIELIAFYYIYLSCMFWLITIPKLYQKELFDITLAEGRRLNISWQDVKNTEKRFNGLILKILHMIYCYPLLAYPIRLCGTTLYKILKAAKR